LADYTLAPAATLTQIVGEVRSALDRDAAQGNPRWVRSRAWIWLVLHPWTRCRAGWEASSSGTNQEDAETHRAVFGEW